MKPSDQFWLDMGVVIVLTSVIIWTIKILCKGE